MKQILQDLLGKFGYVIRRTRTLQGGDPGSADRPIGQITSFLEDVRARGFEPRGIIDVGANQGEWTKMALSIFPRVPVLMIEPQDEMESPLAELKKREPNCFFIKAGAGRRPGMLIQTISEDYQGSSFLPTPNSGLRNTGKQRMTRVVTIDNVLAKDYPQFIPDLVKLDIQGFELEALSGAQTLFGKTELFILEVSLFPFSAGWPLAREVISFMSARDYELYDICGFLRRPRDGALGQLDFAFVKGSGMFRQFTDWQAGE